MTLTPPHQQIFMVFLIVAGFFLTVYSLKYSFHLYHRQLVMAATISCFSFITWIVNLRELRIVCKFAAHLRYVVVVVANMTFEAGTGNKGLRPTGSHLQFAKERERERDEERTGSKVFFYRTLRKKC